MEYWNSFVDFNIENANIELMIKKGLYENNKVNNMYNLLFKNYKIILEKYLMSLLSLKKYDEMLKESELRFIKLSNDDIDYYQLFSTMKLDYLYLRNNLYIEKLSVEDINKVCKLSDYDLVNPGEDLFKLVERTFLNIINPGNSSSAKHMVCYGIDSDEYWFESDQLVFGLRYNMYFHDNGVSDEQWYKNYLSQMKFLHNLIFRMKTECSKIIGKPVNFVLYDEVAIRKVK